jgi:hypothetical protein
MNSFADIDLKYRPERYRAEDEALQVILRNVQGTERHKMITDYWNAGKLEELDEDLLKDVLPEEVRISLGKIHPVFMGGEYLPEYKAAEVEIILMELVSVFSDIISIRARRHGSS